MNRVGNRGLALATGIFFALALPVHSDGNTPSGTEADLLITRSFYTGRSPLHHQNILSREIVRQAVVLSAIHYAGFIPEDMGMDRVMRDREFQGPRIQVTAEKTVNNFFLYSIHLEGSEPDEEYYVEELLKGTNRFDRILSILAEDIPSAIPDFLREALEPAQPREIIYPVPDISPEEMQWQMNPVEQFRVLRYWHAKATREGLTEEVLSGLAQGYATLGQLTRHFWNTFPYAASARALLYAELLQQLHGETDATREVRAYVFALGAYPKRAMDQIEAMESPGSPWISTLAHYCGFDLEALRAEAADSAPHAQLAAFLGMVSVENFRSHNYVRRGIGCGSTQDFIHRTVCEGQ
jgi:hypothetical protein